MGYRVGLMAGVKTYFLSVLVFGGLVFGGSVLLSLDDATLVHNLAFEDVRFKDCVTHAYNSDETTLAKDIRSLRCDDKSIESIAGIEQFPNLEELNVGFNNLAQLDLSKNTELSKLKVYGNDLTVLDVSSNTKLKKLNISGNQLKHLNLSANKALVALDVRNNQLAALDISVNTALTQIDASHNLLSELNVDNNINLYVLNVSHNQLTSLDLSNSVNLNEFFVSGNQLTTIRFRDVSKFQRIDLRKNPFSIEAKAYIETLSVILPVQWGPFESLCGLTWDGNAKEWASQLQR